MATALTGVGVIKLNDPIIAGKTDKFNGMHLAAGQSLRVFADSGTIIFTAFVIKRNETSGVQTLEVVSCANPSTAWTDLYTVATGYSAQIPLLVIKNIAVSAGGYSFGIAGVTVVTPDTGGA